MFNSVKTVKNLLLISGIIANILFVGNEGSHNLAANPPK